MNIRGALQDNKEFWIRLFGIELYSDLADKPDAYFRNRLYDIDKSAEIFRGAFFKENRENIADNTHLKNELFAPFHREIIGLFLLHERIGEERFLLLANPERTIWRLLCNSIKDIPMRVLLSDMQMQKRQNALKGETSKEEYTFYCRNFLEYFDYIKGLCGKYPEMLRLIHIRLKLAYENLIQMLESMEREKKRIEEVICHRAAFRKIVDLEMNCSDSHNGGKQVVICTLDNGRKVVYKPHSPGKEAVYQQLCGWFYQRIGLSDKRYGILDASSCGWVEFLYGNSCESEEQVNHYFKRMGIHLFLCLLLNGSDVHQENILAEGEFPMVLDLETFPGIRKKEKLRNAEDRANRIIRDSVLDTGILPVTVWKTEDGGAAISALYRDENMKSSIKLPVIKNPGTSDMKISYEQVPVPKGKSLPVYLGKTVDPGLYTQDICAGFSSAYRLFLESKAEVEELLNPFWKSPSRFLIRHTQQYSMYLFTSLHPFFLQCSENRLLMLQILRKGNRNREFVEQEIREMFDMDIPYFENYGEEYFEWFQTTAREYYQERVKQLGEEDLNQQLGWIRLSLEMADPRVMLNYYQKAEKIAGTYTLENIEKVLQKITAVIENGAIIENDDISWMTLKCEENNIWGIEPVGIELYDGICGILLFLAQMKQNGFLKRGKVYDLAVRKLMAYTDSFEDSRDRRKTGLLVGIGGISYTWLCLYWLTGERRFWNYAEKQAQFLRQFYQMDKDYDLLSGNAGAVVLLMEMYRESREGSYLELTVEIGEFLWEQGERQNAGYGWSNAASKVALAGMAHGNSGFILAYASLLEVTHDERYKKRIDEMLQYENSLYSQEKGNWRDMRYPDQEAYANAWCHGAAGILLARLKLKNLAEYAGDRNIEADIDRAVKILFTQSDRKGLCICHGMLGNYWIMKEYKKYYKLTEEQKIRSENILMAALKKVEKWEDMMPQDQETSGLMNGLAGMGCVLREIYELMIGM